MENSPPTKERRHIGQDAEEPEPSGHAGDGGSAMFSYLKEVMENVHTADDLDSHGRRILDFFIEEGLGILHYLPEVLFKMVAQASSWIGSTHYLDIIQKVVAMHSSIPSMPQDGLMQCLVAQMNYRDSMKVLCEHQHKLLPLIQMLITVDDSSHTRTRCLRMLIMNNEYLQPPSNPCTEWTEELISTLKLLLEKGADPSWIPQYTAALQGNASFSALYLFFEILPLLSVSKDYLFSSLMEILPLFECDKHFKCEKWQRTALHALTAFNWEWLYGRLHHPPADFFKQYKAVTSRVAELYPQFIDIIDADGKTPLHYFIQDVSSHGKILEEVSDLISDILLVLRSESSMDVQDCMGKTPLHYLAEASPVFLHEGSTKYQEVFFVLARSLTSASDKKDKEGRTPLHILTKSYIRETPYQNQEIWEVWQCFISDSCLDITDEQGQTALHYLAENYAVFLQSEASHRIFLALARRLTSASNKDKQDLQGRTPLHILTESYIKKIPDQSREIWDEVWQCFTSDFCLDIRDNQGRTVLHYLAENYAMFLHLEESPRIFYALARRLTSASNKDMQDQQGRTPLHILIENYIQEIPNQSQEIWDEVWQCFISDSGLDIRDKQGQTALHYLAENYAMFLQSEASNRIFYALARRLTSASNKDKKDNEGFTPLHILTENYIKRIPEQSQSEASHRIFLDLARRLTSASSGQTILHIIARKIFFNELDHNLLNILSCITTSENVNAKDKHSVTPYSWILGSKMKQDKDGSAIFSKVEEIFLQNGANAELAKQGVAVIQLLERVKELTEKVHTAKDLNIHGQEILDLLSKGRQCIMDYRQDHLTDAFLDIIGKARLLLGSTHYIQIIPEMEEMYQRIEGRPQKGPLQCLLEQMEKKNDMKALCKHQEKLLSLIQVIHLTIRLHDDP